MPGYFLGIFANQHISPIGEASVLINIYLIDGICEIISHLEQYQCNFTHLRLRIYRKSFIGIYYFVEQLRQQWIRCLCSGQTEGQREPHS